MLEIVAAVALHGDREFAGGKAVKIKNSAFIGDSNRALAGLEVLQGHIGARDDRARRIGDHALDRTAILRVGKCGGKDNRDCKQDCAVCKRSLHGTPLSPSASGPDDRY